MKPIRPYPGHRGAKPEVSRAYDPIGVLAQANAYNQQCGSFNSNSVLNSWGQSNCNPYWGMQNVSGPLMASASASEAPLVSEGSTGSENLVSRVMAAVESRLLEVGLALRARFSRSQAPTNPDSSPGKRGA